MGFNTEQSAEWDQSQGRDLVTFLAYEAKKLTRKQSLLSTLHSFKSTSGVAGTWTSARGADGDTWPVISQVAATGDLPHRMTFQ